ncbi:MAG: tyrosine-type recombinase/integrase, partial [Streptosporangiaceae bacterium]
MLRGKPEPGEPVKPHTDYREWKRLLKEAGLPEARLHDARHTAATVLLILGVPARTVMSLMGWSSTEMAARYQHVTDAIRREVARQVDGLIWRAHGDTGPAGALGEGEGGVGEVVVSVPRGLLAEILNLAEAGLARADNSVIASARAALARLRTLL